MTMSFHRVARAWAWARNVPTRQVMLRRESPFLALSLEAV